MDLNYWESHIFMQIPTYCALVWKCEHMLLMSLPSCAGSSTFLLLGILEVVSVSPFFATPLCSPSVSNNLVIFHHISSAKLSITDAILSCLQNPLNIVSKKVNVISTAQSGWNSPAVSVFGIRRNFIFPGFPWNQSNVCWITVVPSIIHIRRL